MNELIERSAIVTGAGSGLGKSIAIGLARAGANVAVIDINREEALQTCDDIKEELPEISTAEISCDITSEDEVEIAVETVKTQFGNIDILVNAAGIAPAGPLVEMPVEQWRDALEVNLTGYFLMTKHTAKVLIEQNTGGSIINVSSKSGLEASKDNSPYNATKAGEIHMARGWAKELGTQVG